MSAYNDEPPIYGFGTEFNYALWTEGTEVSLVNVPWNNDYRDIVKFANRNALNAYIDGRELSGTVIKNLSYVKPNEPIRIDLPFNAAYRYNYLRASNPLQPIAGDVRRDYYYFITDVRYIAPNTTEIVVQLDIWQTFGFDATFGNSYIERGHIGIANEDAFVNYGRNYLNIPEGIDIGSEYRVIDTKYRQVMDAGLADILVASTVDLEGNWGTPPTDESAGDPRMPAAKGGFINNIPSGATYYVFESPISFNAFIASMTEYPWISQGIISITMIPKINRYIEGFDYAAFGHPTLAPQARPKTIAADMAPNWRDDILSQVNERYRHLDKLKVFPYMAIEMTTWGATPIIIKPESWANDDATIVERSNIIPPNQRIVFMPQRYNARADSVIENSALTGVGDDQGEYLDFATMIGNFPTLAIVNNMGSMYLAANAHGLAWQNESADWSQQRAMGGANASYDNATQGMALQSELANIGIGADYASTLLANQTMNTQAMLGAGGGVIRGGVGGAFGGPVGVAGGALAGAMGGLASALSTGVQMNANNEALGIRTSQTAESTNAGIRSGEKIRDTNRDLAGFASKGDYSNTIAGINAKVRDSKLAQPSISGQAGGETMNIIHNESGVSLRFKLIDAASIRLVGEYWLRYGYAVRQFYKIPASLHVMSKFTYWKLTETYITAAMMPESAKQTIRGIFEKGVTVWVNPADIGNIDIADNVPLSGFSLAPTAP